MKSESSQSHQSSPSMSPISPTHDDIVQPQFNQYCVEDTMKRKGYVPVRLLGSTLQGSIWKVQSNVVKQKTFVIKVTQRSLHANNIAIVDGKKYEIQENIIKEAAILKYLTYNDSSKNKSYTKFYDFFGDEHNYFLVMEDGGTDFFKFVIKSHELICAGYLSIYEWHRFCKIAFKRMVDVLDWMHNTLNCAHLDISLENFVISDVMIAMDKNNQIRLSNDFQIKLCDFGLAEIFTQKNEDGEINFDSIKYVGKARYKAPRVYGKRKVFDARLADCWSLGVSLFMMITGAPPFEYAANDNNNYQVIRNGKLLDLLKAYNKASYVTPSLFDLMYRIFRSQRHRLNISEIKKHPWLLL